MRDRVDEGLNEIFGKRNNYTPEEIEKAQQRKKKYGGTLMDNLYEVTGRRVSATRNPDLGSMLENAGIDITAPSLSNALDDFKHQLEEESWSGAAGVNTAIPAGNAAALGQQAKGSAAGVNTAVPAGNAAVLGQQAKGSAAERVSGMQKVEMPETKLSVAEILKKFDGLGDELSKDIYGQDKFISKLLIAFKRPFVMPGSDERARNTIFITGSKSTGRHTALKAVVNKLGERGVLSERGIFVMDLSLYPGTDEEKLFLQDLYSALSDETEVILFENFEECHSSFLAMIASLVMKGSCKLSSRYILQNGQLVGITNSLASDTVGSLSAKGKYLVFISEKSESKLADCFGAPFVNSIGDVCRAQKLTEETYEKVSERELDKLVKIAPEKLLYRITAADGFTKFAAGKSEKQQGIGGILHFYELLYKALAATRLEQDRPIDCEVVLSAEDGRVEACFGEDKVDLLSMLGGEYRGELEQVKSELDEIVGLSAIKEYILSLEDYYKVQQRRREEGLKAGEVSKHMIFTGNPGTGKTTIARIISRYLKAIGVLSGGQLIEVSRADLVGRYVGHTAPLVNRVITSALGGVLFIDEAYSLYRGNDDSFGLEAIDTLVKGIEDNRDNLVVILAGYSIEMKEFLTANSGLKSRFPNVIEFPDYSGEELLKISQSIAKSKGYEISEGACPGLLEFFNKTQANHASDSGNGRLARNKVEEAILNQSQRLAKEPGADMSLLEDADFED